MQNPQQPNDGPRSARFWLAATLLALGGLAVSCSKEKPALGPVVVAPNAEKKPEEPEPERKKDPPTKEDPAPNEVVAQPFAEEIPVGKPLVSEEEDLPAGRDLVAVPRTDWEEEADIAGIAISPDGATLAAAHGTLAVAFGDMAISLWDMKAGKRRAVLRGPKDVRFFSLTAVAFSPDGATLAASESGTVHLWNVRTGKKLQELKDPVDFKQVYRFAFTPNSAGMVTVNSDGAIRIWDLKKEALVRTLDEQAGVDFSGRAALAVSADGKSIAFIGKKPELIFADLETGAVKQRRASNGTNALAFSPDGKYLAAGNGKSVVQLSVADEKAVKSMPTTTDEPAVLIYSPSGKTLVAGDQFGNVDLFNALDGERRYFINGRGLKTMKGLALAQNGKTLAAAVGKSILLWDLRVGAYQHRLIADDKARDEGFWAVAGAARGQLLAVATEKGTVIYDCKTGAKRHTLPDVKSGALALDPTGNFLAFRNDGPVEIYDLVKKTSTPTGAFIPARATVFGMDAPERQPFTFSPDGKTLAGGEGPTLLLHRDGKVQRLAGHRQNILAVSFSSDGKWLASGGKDGKVIVWDLAKPAPKWEFDAHERAVQHVAFSPDSALLASAGSKDDPSISLWDLATGKEQKRWDVSHSRGGGLMNDGPLGLAFSPDKKYLATSKGQTDIEIYETATGKLDRIALGHGEGSFGAGNHVVDLGAGRFASYETTHRRLLLLWDWDLLLKSPPVTRPAKHAAAPTTPLGFATLLKTFAMPPAGKKLRYSPDGKRLALLAEKKLHLVNTDTGKEEYVLDEPHTQRINDIAFSPDSATLATCGYDKTVKFWDAATGKPQKTLTDHTSEVSAVAFALGGKVLLSGCGFRDESELIFWDLPAGTVRHKFKDAVKGARAFAVLPDGETVAALNNGKIHLWNVKTGAIGKSIEAGNNVDQFVLSADGKRLACSAFKHLDGTPAAVFVLEVESSKVLHKAVDPGVYNNSVLFGRDGGSLLVLSDRNLELWDVPADKPRLSLTHFHSAPNELFGAIQGVQAAALSPDGKTLATYADNAVKLWNLADLYELPLQKSMAAILSHGGAGQLKAGTLHVTVAIRGRLSAAVLDEIAGIPYPVSLTLIDSANLNDAELARLKNARNLKHLDLTGASYLADAGLKHVGQLASLETLKVDSPRITDAGLEHLHKLTGLKKLDLFDTGSPNAVEKLKKAIPGLQVIR